MRPYYELSGFKDLYLEDSFVLDIEVHPGVVTIDLDAVLLESHPRYEVPPPDEQYCYRRAQIRFNHVRRLHWLNSGLKPARDASGDIDYGGVDEFGLDGETYVVIGNFGHLDIDAGGCEVELS